MTFNYVTDTVPRTCILTLGQEQQLAKLRKAHKSFKRAEARVAKVEAAEKYDFIESDKATAAYERANRRLVNAQIDWRLGGGAAKVAAAL